MTQAQDIIHHLPPWLISTCQGVRLRLYVQPRASESGIVGGHGDALKIRITAPPVDGKANKEICRFLAVLFGLPKSSLVLVRGQTGRHKVVAVPLPPEVVLKVLG